MHTYLTVDWGCKVKDKEVENYCHEGTRARKGIDLPNRQFSPTLQR